MKIASRRFVDVLEHIGASGYRTFPVDVASRDAGVTALSIEPVGTG